MTRRYISLPVGLCTVDVKVCFQPLQMPTTAETVQIRMAQLRLEDTASLLGKAIEKRLNRLCKSGGI